MSANSNETFDLDDARNYWRFAPSGKGKLDSSELITHSDDEFYRLWTEHYDSRFSHYWEERRIVPHFARLFRGKDVLSFGSGLGLNEMQFVRNGARLTCADIVATNLQVIDRVARLEGNSLAGTIAMVDSSQQDFGGPYDYIYANGSLMTMPFEQQKMVLENFKKALKADGQIILMLYTWKFVKDTCGIDSPKAFALRSDPSVGDIHNPWSDWHDDGKLIQLAGAELVISGKQFWNQDYFVWYRLDWANNSRGLAKLIYPLTKDNSAGAAVYQTDLQRFIPLEAEIASSDASGIELLTKQNQFLYAGSFETVDHPLDGDLELFIDAELAEGAFSVSILDVARDQMVTSRAITLAGRHIHLFPIPKSGIPAPFRILVSNFQEDKPAVSRFKIFDIAIVRPE